MIYKELIRTNKKSIRSSICVSHEHEKIVYTQRSWRKALGAHSVASMVLGVFHLV